MPARTVTPASPERPGDPADRRGPFRPARLVTSRARQSGRQAAHGFRLADVDFGPVDMRGLLFDSIQLSQSAVEISLLHENMHTLGRCHSKQ